MSGGAWNARRERPRVADATEATLALPKIVHRGGKILGSEVGPHPVAEEELRIRAFPQQKIRQPLLAARADKQIHIAMLGIMLTRDEPAQRLARELNSRLAGSHGPQYGITRGVVERDTQMQRLTRCGTPFRGGDLTCKPIGQSVASRPITVGRVPVSTRRAHCRRGIIRDLARHVALATMGWKRSTASHYHRSALR